MCGPALCAPPYLPPHTCFRETSCNGEELKGIVPAASRRQYPPSLAVYRYKPSTSTKRSTSPSVLSDRLNGWQDTTGSRSLATIAERTRRQRQKWTETDEKAKHPRMCSIRRTPLFPSWSATCTDERYQGISHSAAIAAPTQQTPVPSTCRSAHFSLASSSESPNTTISFLQELPHATGRFYPGIPAAPIAGPKPSTAMDPHRRNGTLRWEKR